MQAAGIILYIAGAVTAFVGWLWLVVLIFRQSRLLGYLTMFCIPILAFAVLFVDWESSRKPFIIVLAGLGTALAGFWLAQA